MLHPDPRQHHAVRGVVVPQVRVKHLPVNLRYVFRGAETAEANRVPPVSGLRKDARETQVTRRAPLAFLKGPGLLSPQLCSGSPPDAPLSYSGAVAALRLLNSDSHLSGRDIPTPVRGSFQRSGRHVITVRTGRRKTGTKSRFGKGACPANTRNLQGRQPAGRPSHRPGVSDTRSSVLPRGASP